MSAQRTEKGDRSASMPDTSLDERGLRLYDKDNHRLYWHNAAPDEDYTRKGLSGGICTRGDVWDQDAALSRASRPGRLRRRPGESSLLGGFGVLQGLWTITPTAAGTVEHHWDVEVVCRGNHVFRHLPEWPGPMAAEAYLEGYVHPPLAAHGWTFEPRIECPVHRAEREQVVQRLDALLREETQALIANAAPGTAPVDAASTPLGPPPAGPPSPIADAGLPPATPVGRVAVRGARGARTRGIPRPCPRRRCAATD